MADREEQRQNDRAERIDMAYRIEAQPPAFLRGRIPELTRDETVGHLVKHDRDHERYQPDGDFVDHIHTSGVGMRGQAVKTNRPLVLQYGEQHGVADVASPGDAVGAKDAFANGAELFHGGL